MNRTPYARRRPSRTLAALAGAFVMIAALAACVPGPTGEPAESVSDTPSESASTTPTEAATTSTPKAAATTTDVTPAGPLSGTWEGTWVNTTPIAAIGTFRLVWAQQGQKLFGALTVVGSDCLKAGNVTGEVAGKGLSFGAIEGDTTIQYTGTIVDDDTIEGTYTSDCGDSAGTWTAKRTNP